VYIFIYYYKTNVFFNKSQDLLTRQTTGYLSKVTSLPSILEF